MAVIPASCVILTWNEEANLQSCLDSLEWSSDIVVFDSFSTDRTVEIARASQARVYQRKFDNYAKHRNAALNEVQYKHPWVVMLDADERMTPTLSAELEVKLSGPESETTLFRVRRKDMFQGRWIKHSSGYPTWFARVIRLGRVSVERDVHEEYTNNGRVGLLDEHLLHYPFSKGIASWLERHNQYSSMEASLVADAERDRIQYSDLLSSDPVVRRKALKRLGYKLPFRPAIVFLYLYFLRRGFLDGHAGLAYCALRSYYELAINLKSLELQRKKAGLPV